MAQPAAGDDLASFFGDVTVHRQTPKSHEHFYSIVSGFVEKAEAQDLLPIVRVRDQDTHLLLVGILIGCLRRNDHMSVLVYTTYPVAKLAAIVFMDLIEKFGGKHFRVANMDGKCVGVRFCLRGLRRIIVFGIPAIYKSGKIGLFVFNLIPDPSDLMPEDIDPVGVIAIARGMEKTVIKTDAVPHIGISALFQ